MVVYLTLTTEAMARRGNFGDERYETSEMQKNVKKMYERMIETPLWKVVDADKTMDQLTDELEMLLLNKIDETGDKPLDLLW